MSDDSVTFTKLEIAEHQLEQALELFLDRKDYPCAITLAGASEEILGKLLEAQGETHSLGDLVDSCVAMGKAAFREDWPTKRFVEIANFFRNGLKHVTDGQSLTISREAAVEILDRAIDNYWRLTGKESERIRRFMESEHGV